MENKEALQQLINSMTKEDLMKLIMGKMVDDDKKEDEENEKDWLDKVDKASYHENLIRDNKIFNLPKRAELLAWLRKHPRTLELMKNYKDTHFSTILGFDDNNNFVYEVENRFNDNNFIAECGHPYFSRCYADSDRCLDCDLEEL